MGTLNIVLAILLFVSAIFLIVAVLMQPGKDKGAGVITGSSSETYFGRNKNKSKEKKLALLTTIVAVIFIILAILAFILQDAPETPEYNYSSSITSGSNNGSSIDVPSSSTTSSTTTVDTPSK